MENSKLFCSFNFNENELHKNVDFYILNQVYSVHGHHSRMINMKMHPFEIGTSMKHTFPNMIALIIDHIKSDSFENN